MTLRKGERVKLSQDAVIAPGKLHGYLLVWKPADDKSKFLAKAGYFLENWSQLEADLRSQILPLEAVPILETKKFGDRYSIRGNLVGPNGVNLAVLTIWMVEFDTNVTKFITLFPDRRD
jgi:hypothetical protein